MDKNTATVCIINDQQVSIVNAWVFLQE